MGGTNRSGSLNDLLKREQRRILEQAVLDANRDEAHDPACQKELATWERTLTDGLELTSSPKPHVAGHTRKHGSMHYREDTQTTDPKTWSGNLFTDLGLEDADALSTRTALGIQVMRTIRGKGLRQQEARKLLGLKQSDVSAIMRAQFRCFSHERLIGFLNRLGKRVTIHVSHHHRGEPYQQITVVR